MEKSEESLRKRAESEIMFLHGGWLTGGVIHSQYGRRNLGGKSISCFRPAKKFEESHA